MSTGNDQIPDVTYGVAFIANLFQGDKVIDGMIVNVYRAGYYVFPFCTLIDDDMCLFRITLNLLHEDIGDFHRDVEVGKSVGVLFGMDEFKDVRMRYAHHAHVCPASESSLLNGVGGFGEDFPETDGARCFSSTRGDIVTSRP